MSYRRTLLVLALGLSLPVSFAWGQSPYQHRNQGTVLGGLMGAVTGGVIGDRNNEAAAGAAIGAAVGALTGAAIGDSVDADIAHSNAAYRQQLAQRRSQAVSAYDVMSMSQAGLSDSVIITHIHANGVARRPQPNELIAMSQGGVGDTVIQALQTAPMANAPPPLVPVAPQRVIVERHHYAAPQYYAPPPSYHWHHRPPPHHYYRPHPHHSHRSGVTWGFSFSN